LKLFIGFLVGLFLITGCSSSKVKSDFDPKADFSTYKTYQWVSGIKIDRNDELSRHPTVLKVVQASVDKVLKEKGFQQVESGDPDFLVAVHAGVSQQTRVEQVAGASSMYSPWWGAYGGYVSMSNYDEGTLIVDVVDFSQEKITWRGMGKKAIENYRDSQAEQRQQDFDQLVAKIMTTFPPR
jgi:hypothetical protein